MLFIPPPVRENVRTWKVGSAPGQPGPASFSGDLLKYRVLGLTPCLNAVVNTNVLNVDPAERLASGPATLKTFLRLYSSLEAIASTRPVFASIITTAADGGSLLYPDRTLRIAERAASCSFGSIVVEIL